MARLGATHRTLAILCLLVATVHDVAAAPACSAAVQAALASPHCALPDAVASTSFTPSLACRQWLRRLVATSPSTLPCEVSIGSVAAASASPTREHHVRRRLGLNTHAYDCTLQEPIPFTPSNGTDSFTLYCEEQRDWTILYVFFALIAAFIVFYAGGFGLVLGVVYLWDACKECTKSSAATHETQAEEVYAELCSPTPSTYDAVDEPAAKQDAPAPASTHARTN